LLDLIEKDESENRSVGVSIPLLGTNPFSDFESHLKPALL